MLDIKNFRQYSDYINPIIAEGEVMYGKSEINMSSIYTRLIQEAGRYCEHYASDIIYLIDDANKSLAKQYNANLIFGFRGNGVEPTDWILSQHQDVVNSRYRSIWKLDIEFTDSGYCDKHITATLTRVYYFAPKKAQND